MAFAQLACHVPIDDSEDVEGRSGSHAAEDSKVSGKPEEAPVEQPPPRRDALLYYGRDLLFLNTGALIVPLAVCEG